VRKIFVLGDIHFPFQEDKYLNFCFDTIKQTQPDIVVVNGDLLDFPSLSKYVISPEIDRIKLTDQLNLGWQFFSDLRKIVPEARIIFIEGNHEFRFRSYVLRLAPHLYEYVDLRRDLGLDELNVEFIETKKLASKWTDTFIKIDDIVIGHFDTVSNSVVPAGMTIRNIMQKKIKSNNVVQSHCHRGAIIWDTDEFGLKRFGIECPCLCKPPFYSGTFNWQNGFLIIEKQNFGWMPYLIIL